MEEKRTLYEKVQSLLEEKSPEEIAEITKGLDSLMLYYRCAIREVETKFRVLDDQLSIHGARNPIESIKTRLKSMRSIREKLERLGLPFECDSICEGLSDVAGVRVICSFIDDVYMLADCLLKQDDITLVKIKDYIKDPKPNGYRSLHLIIEIPIFLSNEKRSVRVEVQLRTIAMETWANLEHRMFYKNELSEDIKKQTRAMLLECALKSRDLDMEMQAIRDIIEGKKDAEDMQSDALY